MGKSSKNNKQQNSYQTYSNPTWLVRHWVEVLISIVGVVAINLIFIPTAFRQTTTVDPTTAGQLGDFVGGYIGSLFSLISVVLIYATFKEQRNSAQIEKFQNRYFELIKMHRENVAEIGIGKDFGRKIFVILIRELRVIHGIVKQISSDNKCAHTPEELFIISYYALFYGVGPNSSRILKDALKNFDQDFVNKLERKLNSTETKDKAKEERGFRFTPFEGHQSRLSHYYRHLYQTICFVDSQKSDIDKYEYVKTIRAQLTTHEQALLFINSLTAMGESWRTKELLCRYRLVQNIPNGFFNINEELDIRTYFPDDYFEWQTESN